MSTAGRPPELDIEQDIAIMHLWLTLTATVLGGSLPPVLRRLFPHRARAPVHRAALLSTVCLLLPVAAALAAGGRLPPYSMSLVPLAAFLGALLATARSTGLVEQDLVPSVAVREKVRTYHTSGCFRLRRQPVSKQVFDVAASCVALLVTLPFWPVIAFLIWLEEPGPIFFVKHSVGRAGHTFRQVKFRSMRYGAERRTGPVASPADDPRTLVVGRWLRRWHIDELPEVINVLTGSMSLVGPRPLRTVPVQRYLEQVPGYAERHSVKPGIACIAQIEKCHHSPAARLRKDRVYIRCMCLRLDIRLLWRATVTTLQGRREHGPTPHWPASAGGRKGAGARHDPLPGETCGTM
jgi:lipopolysaccharide/colanic/teichoic acid biosynthesis glycosyltransferase